MHILLYEACWLWIDISKMKKYLMSSHKTYVMKINILPINLYKVCVLLPGY